MTEATDKTVKLDIMSDPICPWCFIGKAHLDKALAEHPAHPFVIEWHPFQLNPDMPAGGMGRREYLEAKFGGQQGAVKAYAPVVEHAEKAGLKIDFEGMKRTPNTLDAHRLIHWAGIEGRQTAAVSALFKAYFVDARDIGEHEVLCDIADGIEMDASVVRRLLASDRTFVTVMPTAAAWASPRYRRSSWVAVMPCRARNRRSFGRRSSPKSER